MTSRYLFGVSKHTTRPGEVGSLGGQQLELGYDILVFDEQLAISLVRPAFFEIPAIGESVLVEGPQYFLLLLVRECHVVFHGIKPS